MGIRERISEAMGAVGWTSDELARRIECTPRSVQNYLAGKAIPKPTLRVIAMELGVSRRWLEDGEGDPTPQQLQLTSEEETLLRHYRECDAEKREQARGVLTALALLSGLEATETPEQADNVLPFRQPEPTRTTTVRLLGAVACGTPTAAIRLPDECDVPQEHAGRGRYCVHASGDSMAGAGIPDGALVLCEPAGGYRWRRGDYVVALIDDGCGAEPEVTLKRYVRSRRGTVWLAPESPEHDVQSYGPGTWTIQARAVAVRVGDEWGEIER